ncbi:YhgE/Pip domain-containing protein [Clostridium beijerinckii]|uniref:YhgE/Pip-like protein n=1 Tax=Clostridium beijerinckii TaxID=1520 RepID=A0A9Q5CTQ8_CLOBE|nr:YhgE/Pip domain-containing protein [Clostridium beijerinckii]AQS03417.1 ABC-2 family transporter protein [Clostridium beijerinckii]MBA2884670.1 YhgE/Pip-like protein [Clostridium beijerinckii]MBA2899392.1 YhgE/Pip-like protein [Clostridium beijerinckii]MBA2909021.1 YhgE/Pip-like protein [Clostridium beijerinckii]MBA9017044.1 YhgE/Pip-like protein [Clostridium beijerinckii]
MKNIFRIYKRDINKIRTNWVARLMIMVMIIIPSMYSLINIKASWDPYSNTAGIKIAIINEDKGTVFKDKNINLGEDLVDKLKENDKLGWVFTDKENGEQGLLLEKYYATIEIPENFSEDITTLLEKNINKPKLIYTVNEKKNAIAPKMTDSGIKTVKNELDENVIKTVSGILFRICNERGVDIQDNRPKLRKIVDNIYELDDNVSEIETLLDDANNGTVNLKNVLTKTNDMLPTISNAIDSSSDFLNNSKSVLDDTQGKLSDISPTVKQDLIKSENVLDNSSVELKNLDENVLPEISKKVLLNVRDSAIATEETTNNVKYKLRNIKKLIDKLSDIEIKIPSFGDNAPNVDSIKLITDKLDKQLNSVKNMQDDLKDISKVISDNIDKLDTIENKLQMVADKSDEEVKKIDNDGLNVQTLKDIIKVVDEVHSLVADITDNYDSEIVPGVEKSINSTRKVLDDSLSIIDEGRNTLPEVEKLLSVSQDATNLTNDELTSLKSKLPDAKNKIHELSDKIKDMDEEDKIDELLDMMTSNWENQSDFVASPVEIEDNRLFPWPNYGTATTPFYTVLCLWVGGLLASALLSLEAPKFDDGTRIKPYEMYLGKLLLFLTVGVCQALVASIGSLIMLKVYAVHPIMYIFYSIFVSIIFVIVIYTAASILDDVGKAAIVIILVLQMAGASGNFPIEVAPVFFQKLFPFLPFTYAISGMRQIMAGIVYSILIKDIAVLSIYMFVSLIAGILLKGFMNSITNNFMEKLKKSGILRH